VERLVLFDIDGTILNVHGVGSRALLAAMEAVFERQIDPVGYSMSGKTDTQIVVELLECTGGWPGEVPPVLPRVWKNYLERFTPALAACRPHVYAGIVPLLAALGARDGVVIGLLTGNVEPAAWLKLRRVNLAEPFWLGAFGDAAPERCLLPEIAVENARKLTDRHFRGKEIVIIGDTPNDVACGRHLGVKSIAVATGRFDQAQLASHRPDHLFLDLSDTERVLAAILD
jgi:phosphoglycolate phosphatase-like HAD superfamily hydrolase